MYNDQGLCTLSLNIKRRTTNTVYVYDKYVHAFTYLTVSIEYITRELRY